MSNRTYALVGRRGATPAVTELDLAQFERMPRLPVMYVDPVNRGVIRLSQDPTAGFLVGMRAPEIVAACNAHPSFLAELKRLRAVCAELVRFVGAAAQQFEDNDMPGWAGNCSIQVANARKFLGETK